jgi:broad specificity phosphatase PhoE
MGLFGFAVLLAASVVVGEDCRYDYLTEKKVCRDFREGVSTKLEVVFIRHGFSCANALGEFGYPVLSLAQRSLYRDPPLTDLAVRMIANLRYPAHLPVDHVFSSTMLRAQQTALHLFNTENTPIHLVGGIKEIDKVSERENLISEYPDEQARELGHALNSRVDRTLVTRRSSKGILEWKPEAETTDVNYFMKFLHEYASGETDLKPGSRIAVVTHSNLLKQLFKFKEVKPRNVGMFVKRFDVFYFSNGVGLFEAADNPVFTTFLPPSATTSVPFLGIPFPTELYSEDVQSCKYQSYIKTQRGERPLEDA